MTGLRQKTQLRRTEDKWKQERTYPFHFHSSLRMHCAITFSFSPLSPGIWTISAFLAFRLLCTTHWNEPSLTIPPGTSPPHTVSPHFGAHRRLNSFSGIQLTANNSVSLPCIRRVLWKKHKFNKLAGASIYFWFIFSVNAVLNRLLLGRQTVKIPSGKQFSLRIKIRDK